MEQKWIDFLSSTDINNDFKILINQFFILDNILVMDFIANSNVLQGGEEAYFAKKHATKSLKQLQRVFPPFYPNWFIAAYPDVVNWLLDNHEKSKVLGTLTEKILIELEQDTQLKNDFIRKLINEYLSNVSNIFECTEAFKKNYAERLLKYPKREIDNLGRIIKEIIHKDGYEITSMFHYNRMNQIVKIDKWGEDAYGKWELKPSETFEFDNSGLINKYIKHQFPMGSLGSEIQSSVIFYNEYDSNNKLICTHGPFKTPMYKSYKYDICLKLNYIGEVVEVLFDHEFYDNDYNSNEEKIYQLNIKIKKEDSKEIKVKLLNERDHLRNNQIANRKQKIKNMQMDSFYKKESDSNYTLITKTTTDKLIQILNLYTGIDQFDIKND